MNGERGKGGGIAASQNNKATCNRPTFPENFPLGSSLRLQFHSLGPYLYRLRDVSDGLCHNSPGLVRWLEVESDTCWEDTLEILH